MEAWVHPVSVLHVRIETLLEFTSIESLTVPKAEYHEDATLAAKVGCWCLYQLQIFQSQ